MAIFSSLLGVAWRSLLYRFSGVLLTIVSVAISVFVLLGVEHVRQEARNGFASTVSGVDLIVGARTGEVNQSNNDGLFRARSAPLTLC